MRDPGERNDVAEAHHNIVAAYRARIAELRGKLATRLRGGSEGLSEPNRERLRALGYAE